MLRVSATPLNQLNSASHPDWPLTSRGEWYDVSCTRDGGSAATREADGAVMLVLLVFAVLLDLAAIAVFLRGAIARRM